MHPHRPSSSHSFAMTYDAGVNFTLMKALRCRWRRRFSTVRQDECQTTSSATAAGDGPALCTTSASRTFPWQRGITRQQRCAFENGILHRRSAWRCVHWRSDVLGTKLKEITCDHRKQEGVIYYPVPNLGQ